MEIKKTAIIGLGALGVMYAQQIAKTLGKNALRIVADKERIARYQAQGIYCNGERCAFDYVDAAEAGDPVDLLIFAVKYNGLAAAIRSAADQIGPDTLIISVLNGITSEQEIADAYGADKVLYAVAQGMDAVKTGNALRYDHLGWLSIGSAGRAHEEKVDALARFMDAAGIPHDRPHDILRHMWSKLMLNTGINQTVAVFETNYGGAQQEGEARATMIAAMREVIQLAAAEGVALNEADIDGWMKVLASMSADGLPSMRQDTLAHRPTEVDLFAGTMIRLGKKHGIATPVNDFLYQRIKAIEQTYGAHV
ncbi:MAG: ketopantoate reductase family protein [Sporolactobacillus sp.]